MQFHIAIALTAALCVVGVTTKYETGRGIVDWLSLDSYPDIQPGHVPARSSVEPVGEDVLQEEGRRKTDRNVRNSDVVIQISKNHGSLGQGAGTGVAPLLPLPAPAPLPVISLPTLGTLGGTGGNKPLGGITGSAGAGGGLGSGWGLGWLSDVMKPSWGWGSGAGPSLPALPSLPSLPSLPGLGHGIAAGPGTGLGKPSIGSFLGNKGSSAGVGAGAGSGHNDGIVSVTYGKPPPEHYNTHGAGIFNPFAGWLYPEPGFGYPKGGAGPQHALSSPSTSEVLVVRYPEFIKTIGRGISQMTNSLKNLGQGFSNTLTKGLHDASAGVGSGVYSIISLNEDGNNNKGSLASGLGLGGGGLGHGLGLGGGSLASGLGLGGGSLKPGIGSGGVGGGGGGGPSSTVYVDKHPSTGLGGNAGSWFPNPSSWFGSTYVDPASTSTVYVDKGSTGIKRHSHRH